MGKRSRARRTTAVAEVPDGISCETCTALCCKAPVNMIMTTEEVERHSPPMDLEVVVKPRRFRQHVPVEGSQRNIEIAAGYGLFELRSGCANLADDNRCSIYSQRPDCCRDFAVGSTACR
ncbi:MAG TPA: YkgJ family cysteine cluster protein, partial [Mycobacterium sp.]|nr:YkgJ family cysteine cluster protein [Mycobacterium sp.]